MWTGVKNQFLQPIPNMKIHQSEKANADEESPSPRRRRQLAGHMPAAKPGNPKTPAMQSISYH
jgi:hypothetical protein